MAGGKQKVKAPCQPATLGGGFFGLPRKVIESPAYRDLSIHARAVLIEIGARMDGFNNGRIGIDQRTLRASLRCSPRKVVRALAELMEHGFIDVAAEAQRYEKLAREYRLTFVSTRTAPATSDYIYWNPGKQNGATAPVAESAHVATDAVTKVETPATDAVAAKPETPQKCVEPPNVSVTAGVAHITKPYPTPEKGGVATPNNDGNMERPAEPFPDKGDLAVLRHLLTAYLSKASPGTQSRLAQAADIPGGTLSKFIAGRGLPDQHFGNLQVALESAVVGGAGKTPLPEAIADQREAIADEPEKSAGLDEIALRQSAIALVKRLGRGSQGRLAKHAGINEGTFSTFLHKRQSLPAPSLARLRRSINQLSADAREAA